MPKNLLELEADGCRWPVDEAPDELDVLSQLFCAEPVVRGHSYCSCHQAMSVETKKRRPVSAPIETRSARTLDSDEPAWWPIAAE